MPLLNRMSLVIAAVLFCFPHLALAAGHEQAATIGGGQSHHMKPQASQGVQLSPGLRTLLNQEMGLIQQGVMELVPAIAAGDWDKVTDIGRKIKASFILKQKLTAAQKEELHRVLPQQFIEMDMDFHTSAGMLAHAAEMKNADVVNFYLYKMTTACVSCHGKFATERFPGLAQGAEESHHH
ncbi:hypothetical protein C2E25_13800 [Geothermobacter hydrogeniphilus]|uniref:Cytochrome C n=1 Tax=Geothermobacter hydrogeniphilus TaxID=1969733 RepID=A0A2K2H7D8_9BACT|nr:hypothetical protein [Geothermobacter hydrogeniphilus]PNU19143.1 hypothetical protein C2E25_13800 [Geothermobacter hydrogeniphilus]